MWSQALSITWSCSAIAGPLLGGVFSGRKSFHLYKENEWKISPDIWFIDKPHTGSISWRWGCEFKFIHMFSRCHNYSYLVFINLPICFVAFVILVTSLRGVQLKQASDASWKTLAQKFDFLGL